MNSKLMTTTALLALTGLGLAGPASALDIGGIQDDQDSKHVTSRSVRVVTSTAGTQNARDRVDVRQESIVVTNDNGEISVVVNGQKIPEGEVKVEDGHVIIVDDDGKVIRKFSVDIGADWQHRNFGKWNRIADFFDTEWAGEELVFDSFSVQDGFDSDAFTFDFSTGGEPRIMIGVYTDHPSEALAHHLKIDRESAAIITGVFEGLPAHKAGIAQYDVIIGIDGRDNGSPEHLHEVIAGKQAGDEVRLEVIQRGEKRVVEIALNTIDPQTVAKAKVLGSAPSAVQFMPGNQQGFAQFGGPGQNKWFVATPEMKFDTKGNTLVVPDLSEQMDLFIHPQDGKNMIFEIPDFDLNVDVNSEEIREAIEKAMKGMQGVELDLEVHTESGDQDKRTRAIEIMPQIRVKQLNEEAAKLRDRIESQMKSLHLNRQDMENFKQDAELKLRELPRLHRERLGELGVVLDGSKLQGIELNAEQLKKLREGAKLHLESLSNLHEGDLKALEEQLHEKFDVLHLHADQLEDIKKNARLHLKELPKVHIEKLDEARKKLHNVVRDHADAIKDKVGEGDGIRAELDRLSDRISEIEAMLKKIMDELMQEI